MALLRRQPVPATLTATSPLTSPSTTTPPSLKFRFAADAGVPARQGNA
jgi:hypothetical protein